MKAVMLSIQPVWVEKILNGEKTVEVRKTKPKLQVPFKCYIYQTKAERNFNIVKNSDVVRYQRHCNRKGKVVAEFTCDEINLVECDSEQHRNCLESSCLTLSEILNYCNGQDLYGWHISNLVVYDKPKELSKFSTICKYADTDSDRNCGECKYFWYESNECIGYDSGCFCDGIKPLTRPPQSWCYVEGKEETK